MIPSDVPPTPGGGVDEEQSHQRIAIIEDDPVVRVGLQSVLERAGFKVIALAQQLEEFDMKSVPRPDVVLYDLYLRGAGVDGAAGVRKLHQHGHRVLVLSMSEEEMPVLDALNAGAEGYLTKEAEPEEILRAIRTVGSGRTYLSPTVAEYLLHDRKRLTSREQEVLRLLAGGETAADIAQLLHISEKTVNGHLDRIRDKTGRRRRADLTRLAFEKGIMRIRRGGRPNNE